MAAYLACQSVARMGVFLHHIWHKMSSIPTCVKSGSLPVNKARWRMCAVLLIAGLRITAQVVFTVWRAQQDDDSAGKRSSSSRVTLDLEDDGSTRQQQDSEAATSSKTSKAMDDQPSRFYVKKSSKTDSSSVSVVDRSLRSNGPSGTRGSDHHCSHGDERGRRDRHRGSERRHYPGRVTHLGARRVGRGSDLRPRCPGSKTRWRERKQPPRSHLRLQRQILPAGLSGPWQEVEDSFIQRLCGRKI